MKENLKKVLKKVFIAFIVVLIAFGTVFVLIGMGGLTQYAPVKISDTSDTAFASEDERFVIVSGLNEVERYNFAYVIADKVTRVQYLCVHSTNYGDTNAIEVLVDAAGNPLLYDGELE